MWVGSGRSEAISAGAAGVHNSIDNEGWPRTEGQLGAAKATERTVRPSLTPHVTMAALGEAVDAIEVARKVDDERRNVWIRLPLDRLCQRLGG